MFELGINRIYLIQRTRFWVFIDWRDKKKKEGVRKLCCREGELGKGNEEKYIK